MKIPQLLNVPHTNYTHSLQMIFFVYPQNIELDGEIIEFSISEFLPFVINPEEFKVNI
jgi:hypothetical protein